MAWWATAVEKWPNFTLKLSTKTSSIQFFKTELIKIDLGDKKKKKTSDRYMAYLSTKEPSPLHKTGQDEMEKRKRLKDSFTNEEEEDVL